MPVSAFSRAKPYALAGVVAGLLAVAGVGITTLGFGGAYGDFLIVVGALAVVLGFVVAHQAGREGRTVGQMGWALTAAAVFFTTTMMVAFCISGLEQLSQLALQFPITLVLTLAMGAVAAALEVRFAPAPRAPQRRSVFGGKSGTAHTITMPGDAGDKESVLEDRNRAKAEEQQPADAE